MGLTGPSKTIIVEPKPVTQPQEAPVTQPAKKDPVKV